MSIQTTLTEQYWFDRCDNCDKNVGEDNIITNEDGVGHCPKCDKQEFDKPAK